MRTLLRAWLPVLGVIACAALIYLAAHWSSMSVTHRLSFTVAIMIVLHMFEEERLPGGFGYMYNVVLRRESIAPDRYPMSPFIVMVVDVTVFFVLFTPALFFPNIVWLGVAPMILAIMELLMHGGIGLFIQRRKGMSIYNPGFATALLLAGIGVSYVAVITCHNLIQGIEWLWAFLYWFGSLVVGLLLPEFGLKSRSTPWAFDGKHLLGYYRRYTTMDTVMRGPAA